PLAFEREHGPVLAAILDQVGDGPDLETVLAGELDEIRQASHGAIRLEDFTNGSGWCQARHLRQVTSGFSVAGTHQHPAPYGLYRTNMPGLDQVSGLRLCFSWRM